MGYPPNFLLTEPGPLGFYVRPDAQEKNNRNEKLLSTDKNVKERIKERRKAQEELAAKLSAEKRKTPASVGGAKKEYKSTDTKITFIKNNKEYTRVVYTNKKNTEYVKYENHWIPVSKLHKKGGSPPTKKLKTVTSETGVDERKKVTWKPGVGDGIDLNKPPPTSAYSRRGNNEAPKQRPNSAQSVSSWEEYLKERPNSAESLSSWEEYLKKRKEWIDAVYSDGSLSRSDKLAVSDALKPFISQSDPSLPYGQGEHNLFKIVQRRDVPRVTLNIVRKPKTTSPKLPKTTSPKLLNEEEIAAASVLANLNKKRKQEPANFLEFTSMLNESKSRKSTGSRRSRGSRGSSK